MESLRLPTALSVIENTPNPAADRALLDALPVVAPALRRVYLDILIKRSIEDALFDLVCRFTSFDQALKNDVVARYGALFATLRAATESNRLESRLGAIEIIVRCGDGKLVYLLPTALVTSCPITRQQAARGLSTMARGWIEGISQAKDEKDVRDATRLEQGLIEGLQAAITSWELHNQTAVLEAACWMGGRLVPAIERKLGESKAKLHVALSALLSSTSDPRLAEFCLRALHIKPLRPAAVRAISQATSSEFILALLDAGWLLEDAAIARECRWIRDCWWLHHEMAQVEGCRGVAADRLVRLLIASGGLPELRAGVMRRWLSSCCDDLRRAVVRHLVRDRSDRATELLTLAASRWQDGTDGLAAQELRHRRLSDPDTSGMPEEAELTSADAMAGRVFERYWAEFDCLNAEQRSALLAEMAGMAGGLLVKLRTRLAGSRSLDRVRALSIVRRLGLEQELAKQIYQLASDGDPATRGQAVAMLATLPGKTAERILRTALGDTDERVQANAVEALDRLDVSDRIEPTMAKLSSPHNRVRANAIKSLMRCDLRDAGDALLAMLADSSELHRISALWVIERLDLSAVTRRVAEMAASDAHERVRQRAQRVVARLESDGRHGGVTGAGTRAVSADPAGGAFS